MKFKNERALNPRMVNAATRATAYEYRATIGALKSKTRRAGPVEMRMMCFLVLKVATGCSCTSLAEAFGHKGHGNIVRSWHKAIAWIRVYPQIRDRYNRIAARYCELTKSSA